MGLRPMEATARFPPHPLQGGGISRPALDPSTRSPLDASRERDYEAGMKRPTFAATLFTLATLVLSPLTHADDLKDMEGTWKVESAEAGGKKIESDDIKDIEVKITGERYSVRIKDKLDAGTLKLDETKKPKTMD